MDGTASRPAWVRFGAALPDAMTATFFAVVWIAPLAFGAGAVKTAMLIMLVEFILVHATAMIGSTVYSASMERAAKLKAVGGFALFYLVFVGAFALAFKAWWPLLAFGWLLLGKASIALDRRAPAAEQLRRLQSGWALAAMAYLGGVFLTTFVPLPRLGMTRSLHATFDLPGSGLWVDHPHSVVAFGLLYFGLLSLAKWRDWVLPQQTPPAGS